MDPDGQRLTPWGCMPLTVGCVLIGFYQIRLVLRTLLEYRESRSRRA